MGAGTSSGIGREIKITKDDWENWAYDPEPFQAAINGTKMPKYSEGDGHLYTQAELDRIKKVAPEIQRLAKNGKLDGVDTLWRGESYPTLKEAMAAYSKGKTVTNGKLTSYATSREIAEEYASTGGTIKVVIRNKATKGSSVGVRTDPMGIGGSGEVISPKGLVSRVTSTRYNRATNTLHVFMTNEGTVKRRRA